jgi:amino acid adenylation domain-containing protein
MTNKPKRKLKDLTLFDIGKIEIKGNRVKPTNEFIEFKKEDIHQSIGTCFEQKVKQYADKVAVKSDEETITYGFLDHYANRVAHWILQEYDDRCKLSENEKTRYQRQLILKDWGIGSQERLKGSTVFAAGAGGSGSPLLQQLALIGIGTIIVCDHDEVELSNLNRQVLHDESRIGMNKALSAKITLNKINPHVRVIAHPVKITRENIAELAGDAQIIFDNIDDLEAKFVLSEYAVARQIPHILSSMIDLNAYAVVLHSPYTPCFHCLYDRNILEKIETIKAYSKDYQKSPNPVASPALFLCTGFAVNEAIKILLDFENPAYNKYMLFNQRGVRDIADSDAYRRLTYPFTSHFKKISREQGRDWDQGWEGHAVEEICIEPDPLCPVCKNNKKFLPGGQKREAGKTEDGRQTTDDRGQRTVEATSNEKFLPGGSRCFTGAVFTKKRPPWQAAVLLFGHGVEMIVGLLGVLKSGKVYVPLDPTYPLERLEYMLEDSEARVIITEGKYYSLAVALKNKINKNIKVIDIDRMKTGDMAAEAPGVSIEPTQVAYVLYTSGSTGVPKGVMQSHRNVLHFARVYTNGLHIHAGDRLTLFSSYSFDAAKMDIYGALLNGAALYPFDIKQEGSLDRLPGWIRKEKITIYHSIPTVYRYFINQLHNSSGGGNAAIEPSSAFPGMRFIVLGGEAVYKNDVEEYKKYFPADCLFINGLGPTESTVTLQYFIDKKTRLTQEAAAVGYPVEETEVFLLDRNDQETVVNAVGEIVYKSDYLALGYLKKPAKTNEVFVTDPRPGKGNGRVYRSGDLGRRLEDGSIEYVGRKDFQVKVRGYRIELGEIESKLDRIEPIAKSVVVCQQDPNGENYLTAFYQSSGGIEPDENNLVLQLKEMLPDYMIPAGFYRLDRFPYTPTGKIDRKALSDNTMVQRLKRAAYSPPRTEIEKKMVGIWTRVLNKKGSLGIDDNFFVSGGNSLKAILVTSRIHKELQVKVSLADMFKSPTIRELASFIDEPGGEVFVSIGASETKEYYPLSSAQRRFYILQQVTPGSTAYNMTQVHQLEGDVEKERFEASLKKMIERHETLRTSFQLIDGRPMQRVHDKVEFEVQYYQVEKKEQKTEDRGQKTEDRGQKTEDRGQRTEDRGQTTEEEAATTLSSVICRLSSEFFRPFDLTQAPLLQLGLIKISGNQYILMFRMHHIISDGTSMTILLQEFMTIYSGRRLQPLRLQYKDFAQWQFNRLFTGRLKQQEAYWLKRFQGELPVLNLPGDFPRPPIQSFEGNYFYFSLEKSLTSAVDHLLRETGTTLFMVLLAVYNILLSRYTGQEDIIIGTTVAGRSHPDLEPIIGLFIETLALRNFPLGEQTFGEFLKEVKQTTLDTYDNQEYPFKELIKQVGAENEISRNPVFDAMLIVQNLERTTFELKGLNFSPYQVSEEESPRMSKVDLTIEASQSPGEIHFKLEYCTRLYKKETMERLSKHFINIIRELVDNPAIRLSDIQVISQEEKNRLLTGFNDTTPGYTLEKLVPRLFADQAEETPDNIAQVGPMLKKNRTNRTYRTYISYRELHERSSRLAGWLQEKGVGPDTIVGIMVEPSIEMVIGLLGILKSGGAYLPIDPAYPEERKQYMLADSGARILLTTGDTGRRGDPLWSPCPGNSTIYLGGHGDPPLQSVSFSTSTLTSACQVSPANLAYIIYTSGTTGRPKGVLVEHRNLTSYLDAFLKEFHLQADDTVIQQASYTFDAFIEELYPILLKGGKLAIPGKEVVRDIHALCDFIARYRVTMITCSPQLLNELNPYSHLLLSLRILISGGDRLKAEYISNLLELGEVYNTYGPTESTVCATYYRCPPAREISAHVPIGKPITNYCVYILDQYRNLLPVGAPGELCVAGAGVTRGYLNKPGLTAGKFDQDFWDYQDGYNRSYRSYRSYILYKTGDLARWLPDGNIEFLGRLDRQVKVRGYRIELEEIENQLLNLKNIKKVVIVESERSSGQNFLAAYVVSRGPIESAAVKEQLARQLPAYMIPSYIIEIEEIPLTPSGKVDRQRLPSPRPEARPDQVYAAPASDKEKIVAETWKEVLELNRVGLADNFFDLGGTSLDIFKVNTRLNQAFNRTIPVVALFQHSTVQALARYLEEEENPTGIPGEKEQELSRALDKGKQILKKVPHQENKTGLEIAVIGMAGKFPGARDIDEFWQNLEKGIEGIGFFTDKELAAEGIDEQTLKDSNYIRARGIIADVEYFDASFFGYTPREAQIMDPQVRVFAQCTWHALEDAGYDPFSYPGRIGLYAGASPNLHWEALTTFSKASRDLGIFMTRQLTDKDFMCTHISYKLNLQGPSYSVQTACSTSLTAIHWAVQGLLFGECEMALAGGVSITYPVKRGYHYQPGMIHSADGHNKTFAADATGSVFGDGVGVVVLKKLAEATADRDHIYAIIKGTATNNDGLRKVGYTAPSVEGQAQVIKAAQLTAEVKPGSISYIETHGTATPLGDTVEIEALKQAFNTDKKGFCAIGTVKSNVGHLYSAAGAAGFIKTVLALKHRLIPPTLHFNTPNPQLDFKNSPFYVNTELKEWKNNGQPLRAGVSSFGIGGTNAHAILEEWPGTDDRRQTTGDRGQSQGRGEVSSPSRQHQLILLSAKTPTALDKHTESLVEYLQTHPGINIADMTYTLQVGRKHFPCRRIFLAALKNFAPGPGKENGLPIVIKKPQTLAAKEESPRVIFMFCGQGSQYVNMGIDLYRTEPVFREEMDRCFEILQPLMGYDIKKILYPSPGCRGGSPDPPIPQGRGVSDIHQTEITQPVVFAFEYALARLLMKWGITPAAMIGYSLGEYVAACISGVLSLEDAIKLVVLRGQLMQQTPAGAMTSVPLPEKELKPLLKENLSLAIVNGPTCIVSGPEPDVKAFETEMQKRRVLCVRLNISHAMHSPLMEPIKKEFENLIETENIRLNKPQIPYISNVTADWLKEGETRDPVYWGTHLCSMVRFSDGLTQLLKQDSSIFIEIGPGRILGMMIRVHPDKKPGHIIMNTLKHQQEKVTDDQFLLERLGQLWLHGLHIDWKGFYRDEKRYRLSLPGYPFEGKRYWLEPGPAGILSPMVAVSLEEPGSVTEVSTKPPGPGEELPAVRENDAAPASELEKVIARLWQDFLGVEQVGIHDNFFFLNGNSLLATQLIARLMQDYAVEIPVNRFYENPTIAHLASLIEEQQEEVLAVM